MCPNLNILTEEKRSKNSDEYENLTVRQWVHVVGQLDKEVAATLDVITTFQENLTNCCKIARSSDSDWT